MTTLKSIRIAGYKSIQLAQVDLEPLTVLIGANGSGKSNLLSFFRMLEEMVAGRLQSYVGASGGAGRLMYYGGRVSPFLDAELTLKTDAAEITYSLRLRRAEPDALVFDGESIERPVNGEDNEVGLGSGHRESRLAESAEGGNEAAAIVVEFLRQSRVFHFHDTSSTSRIRQRGYMHDNRSLGHDGGNLAAVLYKLRQMNGPAYRRIVETVRQVAPWFRDFDLTPMALDPENILLNWREEQRAADQAGMVFGPDQLSDGTLRTMALITLLLQPVADRPRLILVDEPELGLHPFAISAVAGLFKAAACHGQVIVATQSTSFVDQCDPQDVVVVERDGWSSTFSRVYPDRLREWLDEYPLGELWTRNVLGGGPV